MELRENRDIKFAGFFIRFLAFFLDSIIIAAIVLAFVLFFPLWAHIFPELFSYIPGPFSSNSIGGYLFDFMIRILILFLAIQFIYITILEGSSLQGTFGKVLLNLKVIDNSGNRIPFFRSLIRGLGAVASLLSVGIGYLLILFSEDKQGLPDILAGTYVIHPESINENKTAKNISGTVLIMGIVSIVLFPTFMLLTLPTMIDINSPHDASGHIVKPKYVGVAVGKPDINQIKIDYPGGKDADSLVNLHSIIIDRNGNKQEIWFKPQGNENVIPVGSNITISGSFSESPTQVEVYAIFSDGQSPLIYKRTF